MSNLTLNKNEIGRWFQDRGDYTHNITYDLTENSNVIDLGGYTGVWANQIIEKYNPNMFILEPVKLFHDGMVNKFKGNPKVHLLNVGVATENKLGKIYMSGDGTSSNLINDESIDVKFNTIETILNRWDIDKVDLIQINIEGDEYSLLEHMIKHDLLKHFKNIQIQFHLGIKNDRERRETIRKAFINNSFKINFDYPFVWESWRNTKW